MHAEGNADSGTKGMPGPEGQRELHVIALDQFTVSPISAVAARKRPGKLVSHGWEIAVQNIVSLVTVEFEVVSRQRWLCGRRQSAVALSNNPLHGVQN